MKTFQFVLTLVVVAASLLASSACSSGREEAPQGRWLSLLALIPDTERSRSEIIMNDYAMIRALFEIDQPAIDADAAELLEYSRAMSQTRAGFSPAEILTLQGAARTGLRDELGFTVADLDLDVSSQVPPVPYQLVRGRLSKERVEAALRADPSFSDLLEEASYNGVDYFHWGYEGLGGPVTAVRRLGEGHQLAILDDTLLWTRRFAHMEEMIDASLGNRPSLGDSEDYQLLAAALEEMGTHTAYFSTNVADLSASRTNIPAPLTANDVGLDAGLVPYLAYGTGAGRDEEDSFTAIVLVHQEDAAAEDNVGRLRERVDRVAAMYIGGRFVDEPAPIWSELISDVQIEREGRVVTAKLYGVERGLWQLLSIGSLLVHE